jgi:hypothetical protein
MSAGLVPVYSYWSGSVPWLDSPACSSETNEESGSQEIISNIVITSAGAIAPPPPPPPPGTLSCGTSTGTNDYYVEFVPPTSVSSPSTATGTVYCQDAPTGTYTCSWYAAGSKFQCSPGSNECNDPLPYINGQPCPFPGEAATVADATATSDGSSLDVPEIAGIVGGFVVLVVLVVIVIVIIVKKKKTEEHV